MKAKDIFSKNSVSDLESVLGDERERLRQFRFAVVQSKIKNVKSGRETRRTIARILTRLNQVKKHD
ncbi:MAG: 50S ribosomal protein L29 [Patescibacteria group bacterium]